MLDQRPLEREVVLNLFHDDKVVEGLLDLRQDGEPFLTAVRLLKSDLLVDLLFELAERLLSLNDSLELLCIATLPGQFSTNFLNLRLVEGLNLGDLLQVEIEVVTQRPHFILPRLDFHELALELSVVLEHLLGDALGP